MEANTSRLSHPVFCRRIIIPRHFQLYGLASDPCNLNEFGGTVCGPCSALPLRRCTIIVRRKIIKLQYNIIKNTRNNQRNEVGWGGLRGFGLLNRTQQQSPSRPRLYHSQQWETTVLEHALFNCHLSPHTSSTQWCMPDPKVVAIFVFFYFFPTRPPSDRTALPQSQMS